MDEHAVHAQFTYALHGFKPSTFLFPSSEYFGETKVIDIGLQQESAWRVWTEQDVRDTLPKPFGNTHKGTFGTGLLIGGCDEMPGSVALVCNWSCSLWYWKAFGRNNEACIPFHWTICT